ncbi:MAG: tRNA (adenine-N1)-methyltransferase [Myxococcota bacterium]
MDTHAAPATLSDAAVELPEEMNPAPAQADAEGASSAFAHEGVFTEPGASLTDAFTPACAQEGLAPGEPLPDPRPVGLYIREQDWVIVQTADGKKLSVRAGQGSRGTHVGELDLKPLVGMRYGTAARTRQGIPVMLMRPTLQDHIMTLKRITQIIYPKDIGTILLKLGIGEGSRVLECGTGSGALTMALAWMVGSSGKVHSYEREKLHHERAASNLLRVGLMDRVVLQHRDMGLPGAQFDERGMEAGFLDVREPTELLGPMTEALAPGAVLGFLVPTANQVSDVLQALQNAPYIDTEVMETFFRKYKVNAARLRPEDRMIGHSGYLIFTRRIEPVADFVPPVPTRKKKNGAAETVADAAAGSVSDSVADSDAESSDEDIEA